MALDQWTFGGARGVRSLVVLAAGTGLARHRAERAGWLRGASGFGAELVTRREVRRPALLLCGRGCGALYVSGAGSPTGPFARGRRRGGGAAGAAGRSAGGHRLARLEVAFPGDPVAKAIVDEAARRCGAIIGMVVNGLNPEVVVITGGLVASLGGPGGEIIEAAEEYSAVAGDGPTRLMFVPSDRA